MGYARGPAETYPLLHLQTRGKTGVTVGAQGTHTGRTGPLAHAGPRRGRRLTRETAAAARAAEQGAGADRLQRGGTWPFFVFVHGSGLFRSLWAAAQLER